MSQIRTFYCDDREQLVEEMKRLGHTPKYDPPAIVTPVVRYTCESCGSRAIFNWHPTRSFAYGSAIEVSCEESKKHQEDIRKMFG